MMSTSSRLWRSTRSMHPSIMLPLKLRRMPRRTLSIRQLRPGTPRLLPNRCADYH